MLGFIAPGAAGSGSVPIENAATLAPDPSLRGTRIRIALDRFWVDSYPGLGTHEILMEFTGKS